MRQCGGGCGIAEGVDRVGCNKDRSACGRIGGDKADEVVAITEGIDRVEEGGGGRKSQENNLHRVEEWGGDDC